MLRVLVGKDGSVENWQVKVSSGFPRLDASAIKSLERVRYRPAKTQSGRSAELWVDAPFVFELEREDPAPTVTKDGAGEGYAGRITAAIKPNIMLAESVPEDSSAEVEIRTEPSGRIVEYRLSKSSGVAAWDSAVLRAMARTERLPLDINGKVPAMLYITFRPR